MAYSKETEKQLTELFWKIEGRKEHEYAAATYKDVPALKEIVRLVEEQLAGDSDESTYVDSIAVLGYVADRYDSLGRYAVSAKFYNQILTLALTLKQQYGTDTDCIDGYLYAALQARNFYIDDDCDDLAGIATELMNADDAWRIINERKERRRSLKHDPIEMTEEYLAVIDEIEEKVEKSRTTYGHGSCFEVWSLTKSYLLEHDIEWHTPAELNPRVLFD
ncbi:MAG: hypothetical protein E7384_05540 [Ruminococcaceae bacterium]|nr:hypothetical protein [Oscillospiraceae bacterium]